jgi:hypothetical protein
MNILDLPTEVLVRLLSLVDGVDIARVSSVSAATIPSSFVELSYLRYRPALYSAQLFSNRLSFAI